MLITIIFDDENYNSCASFGNLVPVTDEEIETVGATVFDSYYSFDSDPEWIVGSFDEAVTYMEGIAKKNADSSVTQPVINNSSENKSTNSNSFSNSVSYEKDTRKISIWTWVWGILAVVAGVECIYLYYKYNEAVSERKSFAESSQNEMDSMSEELSNAKKISRDREREIENLREWKRLVLSACPNLPEMIEKYQACQEAQEFMKKHPDTDFAVASSSYGEINSLLEDYEELSREAKQHVTYNIGALTNLRNQIAQAYAKEAEEKISNIYNSYSGDRYNINYYESGYDYYNGLPIYVRSLISMRIWDDFMHRRNEARRDRDRYVEQQRRRPEPAWQPEPRHSEPRQPEPRRDSGIVNSSSGYGNSYNKPRSSTPSYSGGNRKSTTSFKPSTPKRTSPPRTSRPSSGGRRR